MNEDVVKKVRLVWKALSNEDLQQMFERFKQTYGNGLGDFIFFLTEATEDYKLIEGIIYKRVEFKQEKTQVKK